MELLVNLKRTQDGLRLRTPISHFPAILGGGVILVVGALMSFLPSWGRVIGFGGIAVGLYVLWSSLTASVRITGAFVEITGRVLRRDWPIAEVRQLRVDRAPHILPWWCIYLETAEGTLERVEGVRVLSWGDAAAKRRLIDAASKMTDALST